MRTLNVNTLAEAHEGVVRAILLEDANELETEDKELTFEYPEPLSVRIETPWKEPKVSDVCKFGIHFQEQYQECMHTITPRKNDGKDATYTYGSRFRDYPIKVIGKEMHMIWAGDGRGNGLDQIEWVIKKLYQNPETRRATIHTWQPELDCDSGEPPCLQFVQFLLRDGRLNLFAIFRSNDMLSAYGMNIIALHNLQEYVRLKLNMICDDRSNLAWTHGPVACGTMETVSVSAHIYFKRDWEELKLFRQKLRV
jgi:thymidylate synthase